MSENRGFLTPADKLYLQGEKQYNSKQARYDRRESVRTRTRAAFHDFALLFESEVLDEAERNKIFDPDPADDGVAEMMEAMIKTVAFLYQALEGDADSNAVASRSFRYPFRQVLEHGVKVGEIARHEAASGEYWDGAVEVEFDVTTYRPQRADRSRVVDDLAKNHGRGLTDRELRAAIIHAARDTVEDTGEPTIDGEPLEEVGDYRRGLERLAKEVEERARELADDEDTADK